MQVSSRWVVDIGSEPIWDIALEPGSQRRILLGCGSIVYILNAASGEIEGTYPDFHTDEIYSVGWGKDAADKDVIATGGKDKTVIIWDLEGDTLAPRVKYTHGETIQRIRFNPAKPGKLFSCSANDFGFFSPDVKDVNKVQIHERITDAQWSPDGNLFAYATERGKISIRDGIKGQEKYEIDHGAPNFIWSLKWISISEEDSQIIVYDWSSTVTVYTGNGKVVSPPRSIDFEPCCSSALSKIPYIAVGGSSGELSLLSRDGVRLQKVESNRTSFIWSVTCREIAGKQEIISGDQNGRLSSHTIGYSRVHGMFKKLYASREKLTSISITELNLPDKPAIFVNCREMISKIALSEDILVAQAKDKIKIWQKNNSTLKYDTVSSFAAPENCNMIVCGAMHVIVCLGERITCYSFNGSISREWVLNSMVKYMKMLPGPAGSECLLVATESGSVYKIFLESSFPIEIQKINSPIYLADLSQFRHKLLIVDENNILSVYELTSGENELLFQEPNCTAASWNSENTDLLCYTTKDELVINAGSKKSHTQRLKGNQRVVGFSSSWVYLIDGIKIQSIQVPQTGAMYHYLENGEFELAHGVACIGVTSSDWLYLASRCLDELNLNMAKKAFAKASDYRKLVLIDNLIRLRLSGASDNELRANIAAFNGDLKGMQKYFTAAGTLEKAMEIYTELRMFEMARKCLKGQTDEATDKRLQEQEADWAADGLRDQRAAAQMYLKAGQSLKAIEALATLNSAERLIEISRKLDKGDRKALSRVAELLGDLGQTAACAEIFGKMGDWKSLIQLYSKTDQWDEAFALVNRNPELSELCWTLRADWLAEKDMFIEAQNAYHQAGKQEEALKVLSKLTSCAVTENRYNDAAHYYFLLSQQCEKLGANAENEKKIIFFEQHEKYLNLSEIYYAYHMIHRYVEEPFTNQQQDTLLFAARFLWHKIQTSLAPPGVSKVYILYAFAKISRQLGAYKTARYCYSQLQQLRIPRGPIWETIQLGAVSIRGKPYRDSDDYQIICARCGTANGLINPAGDQCSNCQQVFYQSFSNFEPLPIVEFKVDESLSDEEAFQLIDTGGFDKDSSSEKVHVTESSQRLNLQNDSRNEIESFEKLLIETDGDIIANKNILRKMTHQDVLVRKFENGRRWQFFKNVMPGYQIAIDPDSYHFYQAEDWEMLLLQTGESPFSRRKIKTDNLDDSDDFENLVF